MCDIRIDTGIKAMRFIADDAISVTHQIDTETISAAFPDRDLRREHHLKERRAKQLPTQEGVPVAVQFDGRRGQSAIGGGGKVGGETFAPLSDTANVLCDIGFRELLTHGIDGGKVGPLHT